MRNPRLAGVYAKSLMDFANSSNQLDTVFQDVQYITSVCKASTEFNQLLASPIIKNDKKASIAEAVLKDKISATTWAFLTLIIQKNRAEFLNQIMQAFLEQYEALKGIHEVSLTTAVALDEKTESIIINKLKGSTGFDNINIKNTVKPEIIGGFVLEFDNKLFDASISRKLNDLKLQFADKSYISTI